MSDFGCVSVIRFRWAGVGVACLVLLATGGAWAVEVRRAEVAANLAKAKAEATVSVKHDGAGFAWFVLSGSAPKGAAVRIEAGVEGKPGAKATLSFAANARAESRSFVLRADAPNLPLTATATLVEGGPFSGNLILYYRKAGPGDEKRMRAPRARRIFFPPPPTAPLKPTTATWKTPEKAPACPRDAIVGIAKEFLPAFDIEMELKSEFVTRYKELAQKRRAKYAPGDEDGKRGSGIPDPGTQFTYMGASTWEKLGFLRREDISGETRLKVKRSSKDKILKLLMSESDGIQCPVTLRKKDTKTGDWVDTKKRCEQKRKTEPDGKVKYGAWWADGKFVDASDVACERNCEMFSGYGYSAALDMISQKPALSGMLFGSACVHGRGTDRLAPTDEDKGKNYSGWSKLPKRITDKKEALDDVLKRFDLFDRLYRKHEFLTASECVTAMETPAIVRNELATGHPPTLKKGIPDFINEPGCTIDLPQPKSCAPHEWHCTPVDYASYLWKPGVPTPSWLQCRYKSNADKGSSYYIPEHEQRAKEKKALEDAFAKYEPYKKAYEGDYEAVLKELGTVLARDIPNVCKCPREMRVNMHVTDVGNETHIQVHFGWFALKGGTTAQIVAGIGEKTRFKATPVVSEAHFNPALAESLYVPANDKLAKGDPFAPGGLLHLDDECIQYALKPRLDWLYACADMPASRMDFSTFTTEKSSSITAEKSWKAFQLEILEKKCSQEVQAYDRVNCLCAQGLVKGATFDKEKKSVVLDGAFKPEDLPSAKKWGKKWKEEHKCADQLRKVMILAHETPYYFWDQDPHQRGIMKPCFPNLKQADLDDKDEQNPEEFYEAMEEGLWNAPAICDGTMRAAVYRGDVARCFPKCAGWDERYHAVPPAIPRTLVALENMRRRGQLKVIPDKDPTSFNVRLRLEAPDGLRFRLFARLDLIGNARDNEWQGPLHPPKLEAAFDIVVSPYAYAQSRALDEKGKGNQLAYGVELATDPRRFGMSLTKLREWICGSIPILSDICDALFDTFARDAIHGVFKKDIPLAIQWMMSGSLLGGTETSWNSIADKAILMGVGAAADALTKTGPLKNLFKPEDAQKCVDIFLKTNRLDCKEK